MLKLYYMADTASLAPHIVLKRLGIPSELIEMNKNDGSLLTEEYLKLNPNRRVPTLINGDLVLFESAAICLYLADSDPDSGLMPPLGSNKRAIAYKWLIFMTNSIQADMMLYFYGDRFCQSENAIAEVRSAGVERVKTFMSRIDDALSDGRPFLSGSTKTIVEDYLLMLGRWFVQMNLMDDLKGMAHLYTLLCVLEEDDFVKSVYEVEGIQSLFAC
jgi:glutathione S-transferase